jgi:hypothetical protein
MHSLYEKGTEVNHTERSTKTPSRRTGFVATLCVFLHAQGRGAPSHRSARPCGLKLTALVATLGLALLAPSPSFAAFTRPFLRSLTSTPTGPGGSEVPLAPGGVAIDSFGNLWVGDGEEALSEFNSSGVFVKTLTLAGNLTRPVSLAIERFTGHFYVTGENDRTGSQPYLEVFDSTGALIPCPSNAQPRRRFAEAHVAVDNSTEPFPGPVYVSHGKDNPPPAFGGDELPVGIEKFDHECKPVPFAESAGYIEGNQIVGAPSGPFGGVTPTPRSIAVDSSGNIYANAQIVHERREEPEAVYEYEPSGKFVQAFTGKETPGLGENRQGGGFGGQIQGVAVDPVSGHVLVSIKDFFRNEGAVDEFDSSGKFLEQITETSSKKHLRSALQMTVDALGDLYVVDSFSNETHEHAVDVYGPGHFLPSLKLAEASERHPTSAVVNGSVNPEGLALSDCHFEYVTEAAFKATGFSDLSSGGKAPCVPAAGSTIPVDKNSHSVHTALINLTSGTTYRYRLVATTEGALGGTEYSEPLAFTAPHAPRVDSTSAENTSSTFADLRALIDPLGADTTYHFQYVDEADYNSTAYANAKATPEVDIGSGGPTGGTDAAVLRHIGPLAPGTTYHFRVVAENKIENKVETTDGPDRTFTTLAVPVPGLPDERAYELVTPLNKGSAADMFARPMSNNEFFNSDTGYPSESGNRFLFGTQGAFGPFPAGGENAYVFSRTETGWSTIALASPSSGFQSLYAAVFNPFDFSQVGIHDFVWSAGVGLQLTSLVGPPGGPYTTLHADSPVHQEAEETERTEPVAASHDLSHVVLESKSHTLAPGDEEQYPSSRALYEWTGGELKLVNINSEGELLNLCGAVLGQGAHGIFGIRGKAHNAVSADGSKVFFTAPDPNAQNKGSKCWKPATKTSSEENAPQLYMRSGGETVELSAPEGGVSDPTGRHPATYVGASEDGLKVFFITETELTKDDAGIHDPELYECEIVEEAGKLKCKLTRISAGESGEADANVQKVPAISADGSAIYFTASGRLTAAAPAVSGEQVNLYRYDTNTANTVYVATLGKGSYYPNAGEESAQIALTPEASWYTTPNGRYLLFATSSEIPPVGYNTVEASGAHCPSVEALAAPDGHCTELYRYDSGAAEKHEEPIVCVSCNPSGAPPVSNALFGRSALSITPSAGPVHAMSDDGSKVFFDTADALVPQDGNGTLDVYEWHSGRISLISSGQDFAPSFFLGASPNGANVFFGTHARLVPQDTDTYGDIYDARICTTTDPCIKPPAGETGQCEGDACQNPPPAPIDATPGSLTFFGAGNLLGEVPPRKTVTPKKTIRCSKGRKLSHGKCVKTKAKKKKAKAKKTNRRAK